MMISPEAFYDVELKGKTPEQILKIIRSLKREINRLKRELERPENPEVVLECPSHSVRISMNRDYLLRAKLALLEAGGEYKPTKAEERSETFQERINEIKSISFVRSSFFRGRKLWIATPVEDIVTISFGDDFATLDTKIADRKLFMERVERLYLGEWKRNYIDHCVLDGEQWELNVHYENPADTVTVYGDNEYPYNFDELVALFDAEEEDE